MNFRKTLRRSLLVAVAGVFVAPALGGTVGFEEDFALAPDRGVPLKQLIPGTEEFYYYNTLQQQNTGQLDAADQTLAAWIKQLGRSGRVPEMENRQALLKYTAHPQASLDFLTRTLGLTFNHERETLARQAALATSLDGKLLSRETLTARALAQNTQTLGGFENSALDFLMTADLSDERLHELLSRLTRPDYDNLPKLIAHDLTTRFNSGFGSLTIHRNLLLAQLDALVKLKPELLNDSNFVNVYVSKLRPAAGVDIRFDVKEHTAYLDRLWSFASRLGPGHNSLKACILYQRLVLDRKSDVWDKDRFMAYLQLPRQVWYINPKYMQIRENQNNAVNLSADYSQATLLPPIMNDEPLVKSYLLHFLADAQTPDDYKPLLEANYLNDVFAEAKLTTGIGDQDKFAALLAAGKLQALKERVDIDFAFTNKDIFNPEDKVALDVNLKNVKTLIVKVYEVNAANFYKTAHREINTDINLDGLVANEERTVEYTDPPLRRMARHFDFPQLNARGVYVVEFIGNGKSSRALVRKGKFRYLERDSSAGQLFVVLDEANKQVNDARLWLAGHECSADKDGLLVVPYSTHPQAQQAIVLQSGEGGGFASLDFVPLKAESYSFAAPMHIARESLLRYGKATLIIRPTLFVQSTLISTKLLEEVVLTITSVDRDGIAVSKEVPNFKLFDDRETTYELNVPDRLKSITLALKARIQNVSLNKKEDLAASHTFTLNEIEQTPYIEDLHLSRIDGGYVVDVLGKTGETLADQAVNFTFKHRDFTQVVHVTLKSDAAGRMTLGALEGIDTLTAQDSEGLTRTWLPGLETRDNRTDVAAIHALAGEVVRIPYMGSAATGDRAAFSLLELTDNAAFVADRFSALAVKDAFLEIKDLPPGDYDLLLKNEHKEFTIRIAKGDVKDGWILAASRQLQQKNKNPLQIVSAKADATALTIQLANANKLTRVHVFATRFVPAYLPFADLAAPAPEVSLRNIIPSESLYESGRLIGDEYRYILDRKYATKYPGNTLARPGLLINPWAIRSTQTEIQEAAQGGQFHGGVAAGEGGNQAAPAPAIPGEASLRRLAESAAGVTPDLDFLAEPAAVLVNLQPDEKGVITIARKDLGSHQEFHIIAVDPNDTVYREVSIAQGEQKVRDLRLAQALDSTKHFTEQKQISILQKGQSITVLATSGNALESYDALPKLYRLYATLHPDANLAEFAFILNWPTMKDEEKREKYSKYACHELNFFLAKKDPAFFQAVIQPYLKNKKDKTFMDHFLLGDDLAGYLAPWSYGQLNTVERILLAQRINAEGPKTARFIKDNFDLIPPDIERFNYLFSTALSSSALSQAGSGSLGWAATQPTVASSGFDGVNTYSGGITINGGSLKVAGAPNVLGSLGDLGKKATEERMNNRVVQKRGDGKEGPFNRELIKDETDQLDEPDAADKLGLKIEEEKDLRKATRVFYRPQDKTMEYVENNYYHLPIEQQIADLVKVNAFWNDYAQNVAPTFLSKNIAEAASNFTEIMFALAVTDLPFEEPTHTLKADANAGTVILTAAGPIIAFHKEIKEAPAAGGGADKPPILVSQNYFRLSDRYTFVDNERTDKYLSATDEFLTHVVYGCQVVITNPTSSRQKLDALMQIPQGALPVANAKYTNGLHLDLQPYETKAIEYDFYFPATSQGAGFPHYPVQVAKNEKLVASVSPATLKVVATPSKIDTASWDYISQNGTSEQTLDYLKANNLERTNLDKIAWRMKDKTFYAPVMALLRERHVYQNTLWSYSIKNDDPANISEFLQHQDNFVGNCGLYLHSPLLVINPVARHEYQHMEYLPLVNARAHRLGQERTILNNRFFAEYEGTLTLLRYHPALTDEDMLAATYDLLLQDRIDDGLKMLARVNPKNVEEQLQFDYFTAYSDFFTADTKSARAIAEKYKDYKVDRWKNLFLAMLGQLDEIDGKGPAAVVDKENRDQQQNILAATEPTFDFHVDNKKVILTYKNIPEARVNYYLMDIELMFSENPFLLENANKGGGVSQFSIIKPNDTAVLPLEPAKSTLTFDLPEKFLSQNVMVEITAAGQTKSQAYYANSLSIQIAENYGELTVTSDKTGKALPKVYVKVYARFDDGRVRFYKDGYTDLRGKFEYAALSTDELDHVQTFSLLILTDTEGAIVKTAQPPKR